MAEAPPAGSPSTPARVVIAGGGFAGLEAVMALRDLAGDLAELAVISPDPDFTEKPLVVEEPFSLQPAARHELRPLLDEVGASLVAGSVASVDAEAHAVELEDGTRIDYDVLVVCVGGRAKPAYRDAITFWADGGELPIDDVLAQAAESPSRAVAFVVPPRVTWSLPLYELALMSRGRAEERGLSELRIELLTPEDAALALFGPTASEAVAELLEARRIELRTGVMVAEDERGAHLVPGEERLDAKVIVALPEIEGPALAGLPADEHGFIPIDEHCRVPGAEDVYAAGDGTDFPVKQGGIGTQQADAAAEHVAAALGAGLSPEPFRPVLRGRLVTGAESLSLRHDLTGGHGEGTASLDYLWWPPDKVSGRYLAARLSGEQPGLRDLGPDSLEIDVALPHHGQPMAPDDRPDRLTE